MLTIVSDEKDPNTQPNFSATLNLLITIFSESAFGFHFPQKFFTSNPDLVPIILKNGTPNLILNRKIFKKPAAS